MQPSSPTATVSNPGYRGLIAGLAALLLLQLVAFAVWQKWFRRQPPAAGPQDVVRLMQQDVRDRRYDDAVQSGQSALKNLPGDDVVLQQIAVVYLRRAQIEGDADRWAKQAAEYAEKALVANPHDQINLYSTARALEIAGDFSPAQSCADYVRSAAILQDRLPMLIGDHLIMNGRPAQAASLRQENEYLAARVKMKIQKRGCK